MKEVKPQKILTREEIKERMKALTHIEADLFSAMYSSVSTGGCVYFTSDPGDGKTSLIRDMAKILGFALIDVRVSQKDETQIGLFPKAVEYVYKDLEGNERIEHYVKDLPPEWALIANQQPTIICFEELNRASRPIRNASLQILMEREIGHNFKFNDNVFLIATGNEGDEDTEEFSKALKGRLIHFKYIFNFEYWVERWANKNLVPHILQWLFANQTALRDSPKDDEIAYCSPRSVHRLSGAIEFVFDKPNEITEDLLKWVARNAPRYIGKQSGSYLQYLQDRFDLKILDILNNFESFKDRLETVERTRITHLTDELLSSDKTITSLTPIQIKNLNKFLRLKRKGTDDFLFYGDILVGFLKEYFQKSKEIFENDKDYISHPNTLTFVNEFRKELEFLAENIKRKD